MSGKRAAPKPRYARISAFLGSILITGLTVLAGLGIVRAGPGAVGNHVDATPSASPAPSATPDAAAAHAASAAGRTQVRLGPAPRTTSPSPKPSPTVLPGDSGSGRRVVFDMSLQRVWLVEDDDEVRRTYLVSGSVTDNLDPGRYAVYSRSRYANGVDESGTMQYFVRFTRGQNAAIGFHDIPVLHGELVQSKAQLGTPQSHGCIRQDRTDAIQLWDFAPVGTEVDVVA